jgi:hypothetical protein
MTASVTRSSIRAVPISGAPALHIVTRIANFPARHHAARGGQARRPFRRRGDSK